MIKYTSNSLLATLISFSNEIAGYCEAFEDVDVADVFGGVHQMRHLVYENGKGRQLIPATSFLWPGCGFGGSCFPKDVKALVAQAQDNEVPSRLLTAVLDINARQPDQMIKHLLSHYPSLEGRTVAVLGLAFKPDTDDVRESPALRIVPGLLGHGAKVVCHDPVATGTPRRRWRIPVWISVESSSESGSTMRCPIATRCCLSRNGQNTHACRSCSRRNGPRPCWSTAGDSSRGPTTRATRALALDRSLELRRRALRGTENRSGFLRIMKPSAAPRTGSGFPVHPAGRKSRGHNWDWWQPRRPV